MKRAVRSLLRVIAAALMMVGGVFIALEIARHRLGEAEISIGHCVLSGLAIAAGVLLLVKSSRWADRLADDFEE